MSDETVTPFSIYRECQTGELKEHLKPTPLTSAERQRAFRARREAEGFFQVSGIVGGDQIADVNQMMRILRANPDLVPVLTFRNVKTGRMVKVNAR